MRITLGTEERFYIWGKRVVRLVVKDGLALMYGWTGYVGVVDPDQVPEIHNAIETRKPRS
jgi:hypothetical protein